MAPTAQLLCITLSAVSFDLQGCGPGPQTAADIINPDTSTEHEARAVLSDMQEHCKKVCTEKCTFHEGNVLEVNACHACLSASCTEAFVELQVAIGEHWNEPVCEEARSDAARCWADVSECVALETQCLASTSCDLSKIAECWDGHTEKCLKTYLPCCHKEGVESEEPEKKSEQEPEKESAKESER